MHLTLHTLTLLGGLSFTLAEKRIDLGYMKCASAIAQSTDFPSCNSSYKLDCFCETQKASHGSTARLQIAQEAENLCAENGVPREELAKYLCDDTAVPASPRRGSTPMGRLEGQQEEEQEQQKSDSETPEDSSKEHGGFHKPETTASKRAMQPDSVRPLIPENDPEPDTTSDEDNSKPDEGDKDKGDDEGEEEREAAANDAEDTNAAVAVVTVTETVCPCDDEATATPDSEHSPETSAEDEAETPEPTSGAMHRTEVVESSSAEPTGAAVSTVRAASSDDAGATPVPTGVDGERQNGPKGSESAGPSGEMYEGGAMMNGASKSVVVGVLGVVGGMVLF
ncbi:hypothetical protein ASPSYDRAFT_87196 [Aspergillus sydowii CBS 593.65]|uniref:Extracellular membrane protein CFEM domain-containing protein n=1 Tax=Aspergillus sydowii CBS 593.65 TaxID=1036612 RepID=A0A1L9TMG7_9EURO|nr:uncharacterized protein ASPSYDRAFT_87196 [Aspergillus sydowii CBS 593.65]OJJ60617.1 hypothetical protein ASPSYDRAFT_87196 [Aspergillus sydowii CBS 593.65]